MNKQNLLNIAVGGAALVGGYAIGSTIGKTVMKKAPQFEPVLIWASGALVGASLAAILAPRVISKSTAGSILASD